MLLHEGTSFRSRPILPFSLSSYSHIHSFILHSTQILRLNCNDKDKSMHYRKKRMKKKNNRKKSWCQNTKHILIHEIAVSCTLKALYRTLRFNVLGPENHRWCYTGKSINTIGTAKYLEAIIINTTKKYQRCF